MSFYAMIMEAIAAVFLIGICAFVFLPLYEQVTGVDTSGFFIMFAILALVIVISVMIIILKKC